MRLALQAADLLGSGKVDEARSAIASALAISPDNELALKLRRQVEGDVPTGASWRYTMCADDTLSKVAERFLNDRFQFWQLARLNGISVPKDVRIGQVVQIPGSSPPADHGCAVRLSPPVAPPPPPPAQPTLPAATSPSLPPAAGAIAPGAPASRVPAVDQEVADGDTCYRNKDLACACRHYDAALRLSGDNGPVKARRDKARHELQVALMLDAKAAQLRQELDCAANLLDRVLELDPQYEPALAQRKRIKDLARKYRALYPDQSEPTGCSAPHH